MGTDAFDIDTSDWPIVVMRLRGELTTDEYREMMDACEVIVARRQRYVGITDLREVKVAANAAQRKYIADRITDMEKRYGHISLRNIMIVDSAFMRGALTAVEWLRKGKKRDLWVASMDEALKAARRIAHEEGLTPQPVAQHMHG